MATDTAPPISSGTAEEEARKQLPAETFEYASGGAGDESTVRRNTARLDSFSLVPRMLRDVSGIDTGTDVVGGRLAAPFLVAPMGMQGIYHEGAESAAAAAAAHLGLGFCLSTFATHSPKEVAGAAGRQVRWRQVYLMSDSGLTDALVEGAEEAGFDAVVCTVDVPVMGVSRRDAGNVFDHSSQALREPAAQPAVADEPYFTRLLAQRRREAPDTSAQEVIDTLFPNPAGTWQELERLIDRSRLPVIVKGVLHPEDATRAIAAGAAAVVVSNHGGYQHDRSVTSIDALPGVARAVGGSVPVYFDSGIRRGSHAAVALARGASAVLVGRPVLWGLAVDGRDGVAAVLRDLVEDLRNTMAIVGARTVDDLAGATVPD
ncbi:alpha-hydroxy acid oxidase [Streptomyces sp. NPDC006510]|uniref:alpha-hydroxy acid oxidase n=1 Tax=Streptomyces sp. NPDC006510 TaxID=3155600 RepID=UPI0033BDDE94